MTTGNYIHGAFCVADGDLIMSRNPAKAGEPVVEMSWSPEPIDQACDAARSAAPAWFGLSRRQRWEVLERFRSALEVRAESLAEAIVLETGKLRSEARTEIQALLSRFRLVADQMAIDLKDGPLPGRPSEQLRHRPLGVVGVIGPFNFPLHLCHAHVIPALLAGNTVVIKPSEVTPLCAVRYAEAAHAAEFPPGVFNLVHGKAAAGARLVANSAVRGLCFTGSYPVGRKILEAGLDRPELLIALEMGGKNTVIVLEDAELRQAAHEIVVGGYLTTGQRCTGTDRVLVHRKIAGRLIDALRPLVGSLRFGNPDDAAHFAGPLATKSAADRFWSTIETARLAGAEPIVVGGRREDGYYIDASLHRLPDGEHHVTGYTDVEVFGPDVVIEVVNDDDEAIEVIGQSAYGFANSVFTASDARFEHIYRNTNVGILNRNRSTNLASPRLPFGGVGKSGNYRPAGAYAGRNVVLPMAVQENVLGAFKSHVQLMKQLPAPDLNQLAARHDDERKQEASRNLIDTPRPMALRLTEDGRAPASQSWLARLYAGDRIVREKKPFVFDHLRSAGAWFVSVDSPEVSVIDGMSQTATLCGGFSEHAVARAYIEGEFGCAVLTNPDTTVESCSEVQAFADVLRHLVDGLPNVTFANSGAEANEKALALCRQHAAFGHKVLAFEGSFHGRTLVALHATHNPAKRAPYEFSGYESAFAPFPVLGHPEGQEPAAPAGFYAMVGAGELDEMSSQYGDAEDDPLLASEVASLVVVHELLKTKQYFACIIEPMQSEGGDRYATARFFRALRLLTRFHGVALVMDEVQTGFGLGGPFAWHSAFRLVNVRGQPDYPDAVSFAKRAQVGVVMSRFVDPEPTATQAASLIRGRIHAEMMSTPLRAQHCQAMVQPLLAQLSRAYPQLVANPRARGYAFAFDLPDPDHLKAFLGQRFWRGAIVFGAGSCTARYRLSLAFGRHEIGLLFDSIRRALSWIDANPGKPAPAWEHVVTTGRRAKGDGPEYAISTVDPADAMALLPGMLDVEYQVYEPVRRTAPAQLRAALTDPEGIVVIAEVREAGGWQLAGFAIGAPLEQIAEFEEGPDQDVMIGEDNTLYSLSLTVAVEHQGRGLGRALKRAQLSEAASRKRKDGSARFRYVTGRNRVGHTASMTHLNHVFGAHEVSVLTGQYADPEGQAIYYRIPLSPWSPAQKSGATIRSNDDISGGIVRPLVTPPQTLIDSQDTGLLYGPTVNKITLLNYTTPAVVRATEWLGALIPEMPHLYYTSSRDETVDKAIRILRWHRPKGKMVVSLSGSYVGHTTGSCRSISDGSLHAQGEAHFDWPKLPHPLVEGADATIRALAEIASEVGDESILGIVCEFVGERSGMVLPESFALAWQQFRTDHDIPLVLVETASAGYRSGQGVFGHCATPLRPDLLLWWGGAHTGYVHVVGRYHVAAPLAMASTWDGDELSLVREYHQLRAARLVDTRELVDVMDALAAAVQSRGVACSGLGLYRVIEAGERGAQLVGRLGERGFEARNFVNGNIVIAPALDQDPSMIRRLTVTLGELL